MLTLLTGATGYLGGHVLHALQDRGHDVRALVRGERHRSWLEERSVDVVEGDLRDYATLRRACHGAEGIVHCAAMVAYWSRVNAEQRQINVEGTSNLLRAAGRAGARRIVHVSSIAAVGCTRDGRAVDEDEPWDLAVQPRVHYLWTKRESEERAFAAARGGLPITIVNPTTMIGPRAQDGRPTGHLGAVLAGDRSRPLPGGSSVAYVADTARSIVAALEDGPVNERTILGGANATWRELRASLARALDRPPPAAPRPAALGGALAHAASALELLHLGRPRHAADLYRSWGWYSCATSDKAARLLGHPTGSLDEVVARASAAATP